MFFEDKVGGAKPAPLIAKKKPAKRSKPKKKPLVVVKAKKELVDLWGDTNVKEPPKVVKGSPVALQSLIAQPGQSFNPNPIDYRKALEQAAEPEFAKIKEQEVLQEKATKLEQDYIHPDEPEQEPVDVDPIRRSGRRKKKSERNKAKRRKDEQKILEKEMQNNLILEQIESYYCLI
jgi:hypothetical protein